MAKSLTPEDIDRLRAALADNKPTPVWFTEAAVGVATGQQAKVIAFDEPAEGDFIQVRPNGSRDVLQFSPAELTAVKPPAKPATPRPRPRPTVPEPVDSPEEVVQGIEPGSPTPTTRQPKPRKQQPTEITVTLHATPEGEWSVDVLVGKKRTVRWEPVTAGDIAKAAKHLPPAVGEAIEGALTTARERGLQRVEELKAQLEAAQRALRDLG
ncbi:DUF6319 family protein [Actinokineospora auranticolor]|uniref:Uncharacterized protein n=1 Tax=Actinokineospora auranticolor TaxID=155976 RepID=A0A2S6GHL5_9PSEU|nr:DUF6319 family protein [Actinokineospora auranticolor]PPK64693.1 hypothetical protein CLV40_11883 [Actinokineospora auranticolor]